jgi:hypothetical protein
MINADIKAKEGFWNVMSSGDTKEAQQRISNFIRLAIEEEGFWRNVMTPTPVSPADCQRALDQDEFVYLVDLPVDSSAGVFTFFGEGRISTIRGRRVAVPFVTITSQWQQWHKRQFLAYPWSVEDYLRTTFAIRMQTCEDWYGLTLSEASLALSGKIAKGVAVTETGAASGVFEKEDLVTLKKQLTKKMVGKTILITAKNAAEMGNWNSYIVDRDTMIATGKKGEEAFLAPGYFGLKWVRTIKEDLLAPGNIYLFGPQEYLGVFLTLGGVDFMMERYGNYIKMGADEAIAMCIVNYNALAKLELYSGASNALPSWEDIHALPTTTAEPNITSL